MIARYASLVTLGHPTLEALFTGSVIVEEKIDGSQISFGVFGGSLFIHSKNANIDIDSPEKMFAIAVKKIENRYRKGFLKEGYTYRGEYLRSPHHNTLSYDRIPESHIMIFDIDKGNQDYLSYEEKSIIAYEIGFECVPCLFQGLVTALDELTLLLNTKSILGGANIEGFVVKNYNCYYPDKKVLMAKYVSEAFKEIHGREWRKDFPTKQEVTDRLVARYKTPARWQKAVIHLAERGEIESSPRDIGKLVKEVMDDTRKECEEEIKDILFDHFWPGLSRSLIKGVPEWYKEQLLQKQCE